MSTTKRLSRIGLVLALVLTGGLQGCRRSSSGGGGGEKGGEAPKLVKLAFVTNNTSEFWKIAGAGIRKYEKEGKVQVDLKMPSSGTTESQNQILQDLSSQGYNGIAVSVIAPNDQIRIDASRFADSTRNPVR